MPSYINPFSTNVPLLYTLKITENLSFSYAFKGYRSGTSAEYKSIWQLIYLILIFRRNIVTILINYADEYANINNIHADKKRDKICKLNVKKEFREFL